MDLNTAVRLQRLEHVLRQFFIVLAAIGTCAGVLIILLVGSSVVMRHVAHAPFRFTEELVGLLMTATFFLTLPLITLDAQHVRVQIVVAALPARLARFVTAIAACFGIVFTLWFLWLCIPWFEFAFQRSIKTEVGRLLMYPWMALLPLSLLLTAVAFAFRVLSISAGDNAASDEYSSVDTPP